MTVYRVLVLTQASYTLITAVWPLIDIESFMEVSGYKRDVWLVKTVGALLVPVALCLYAQLYFKSDHRPTIVLGSFTALAFACIDFYYALNDVIPDIYLADGVVELIFLGGWLYIILYGKKNLSAQ